MKRLIALFLAAHVAAFSPFCGAAIQQQHAAVIQKKRAGGAAPTYLINQNFEGAGYDNGETWTEGGSPNENYAAAPLLGSESLRIQNGASDYSLTTFAAQSTVYGYALIRFAVLPSSKTQVFTFEVNGVGGGSFMEVDSSGNVTLNANGGSSAASATTLSTGTTYSVWLKHTSGGASELAVSTTTTKPSVDGSGNVYLTKTAAVVNVDEVFLYVGTGEALFDHVLVSTAPIGDNP